MNVLLIACSLKGCKLMELIDKKWRECDSSLNIIKIVRCRSIKYSSEKSLDEIMSEYFYTVDAVVFICAVGIAVRTIAPYIKHKSKDPAVIVIDEKGCFCISLLSGHIGGANRLCRRLSEMVGAVSVITTATDVEGKFSPDDFAGKNNMIVSDWKRAKDIAVRILENKIIRLYSEFEIKGKLPENIIYTENIYECDIYIGIKKTNMDCLCLIPRIVVVGMGCKKNTGEDKIENALKSCIAAENIDIRSVCEIATIDIKKNEAGLISTAEKLNAEFIIFSADELEKAEGKFSSSDFVKSVTGVSNVCERSAALRGRLICKKKVYDGVTAALAVKESEFSFE